MLIINMFSLNIVSLSAILCLYALQCFVVEVIIEKLDVDALRILSAYVHIAVKRFAHDSLVSILEINKKILSLLILCGDCVVFMNLQHLHSITGGYKWLLFNVCKGIFTTTNL